MAILWSATNPMMPSVNQGIYDGLVTKLAEFHLLFHLILKSVQTFRNQEFILLIALLMIYPMF